MRKAYDLLIQAEAGLAGVTGTPDTPSRIGVSIVDVGTGMFAYEAILEALIKRGRTGEGADIKLSMFDCMAEFMAVPLLHGRYGKAPGRIGLKHPSVAPYGVFACASGPAILISIQNDREWRVLADQILGRADLGCDPRFATNIARIENRAETDSIVSDAFAREASDLMSAKLADADIAFGRVNEVMDVLAHTCLRECAVPLSNGEAAVMPASPARIVGAPEPIYRAVPDAGADTDAVRREFLERR
ncbi:MAG: CaiB/BaiF CoA-transferase family protein [Pseudomonadota bacterium]